MTAYISAKSTASTMLRLVLTVVLSAVSLSASYADSREIAGIWRTHAQDLVNEHGNILGLPYNETGREIAEQKMAEVQGTIWDMNCVTPTVAVAMFQSSQSQIIEHADHIEIVLHAPFLDSRRTARTIWMDGRPHPGAGYPHSATGFSTGRWDGNTLVVETTHIAGHPMAEDNGVLPWVRTNGAVHSDAARLTEYLTRQDEYLIHVSILEDPYFIIPLSRSYVWERLASQADLALNDSCGAPRAHGRGEPLSDSRIPAAQWTSVDRRDLSGAWGQVHFDRLQVSAGDWRAVPLNDEGLRLAGRPDYYEQEFEWDRTCAQYTVFHAMGWRPLLEISAEPGRILMFPVDWLVQGEPPQRSIWLDSRAHPDPGAAHTRLGFSTGRWDGNTLVVSTTHIAGYPDHINTVRPMFQRNEPLHSTKTQMMEYFIRYSTHMSRTVVYEDPVYLTKPIVRSSIYRFLPEHVESPAEYCAPIPSIP